MAMPTPRFDGSLGSLNNGLIEVSQSHDEFRNLMRFKVRTTTFSRTTSVSDEVYMTDYPDMKQVEALIKETSLHVLLDAREKINEAIADLMGRAADA